MRELMVIIGVALLGLVVSLLSLSTLSERREAERTKAVAAMARAKGEPEPLPVERGQFEDAGIGIATAFTGPIHDPASLAEIGKAVSVRGALGLSVMRSKLERLHLDGLSSASDQVEGAQLYEAIGKLLLYDGRFEEASAAFLAGRGLHEAVGSPTAQVEKLTALMGIAAMRRGEVDNCIACLGPSSCILPIVPEAMHTNPAGSKEAIAHFERYLAAQPDDLRVRWLLNVAHMTLGQYPAQVPAQFLIPLEVFASEAEAPRFTNVAPTAGVIGRGTNLAGGSIFDDFNGDSRPDLFTTSLDASLGASFYVNNGDGTFSDRTDAAGVGDQVYALNIARADYDNDGNLDVLLLRGAWEKPMRMSLLRNAGDGRFEDVTEAAGLLAPISSEAAAWGDFDNDGWIDVFVGGEFVAPFGDPARDTTNSECRARLYRNLGNGRFEDMAAAAGVTNERCVKGAGWCDYDEDGDIDLFVSNMGQPCRMYRNEGGGRFVDIAPELGLRGGTGSFACWFWDYDNDGKFDLFLVDNFYLLAQEMATALGLSTPEPSHPRLYRNVGEGKFEEVSAKVGLDRAVTPMGCNFGDIDNDGYLDFYLGTGAMSFEHLVPNRMFKNDGGKRFLDVTYATGTGHLQKGHGVSFADFNNDGHVDLFVEIGGAVPGDAAHNLLFQNQGNGNKALKVKLVGTKTNRAAIGARIRADVRQSDGTLRSIYRTVGNNSSFGGNTLVEHLGLGAAGVVENLEVDWPVSGTKQVFHQIEGGRSIRIHELAAEYEDITP